MANPINTFIIHIMYLLTLMIWRMITMEIKTISEEIERATYIQLKYLQCQ